MTSTFVFGTSSKAELKTVHPLLQKLASLALLDSPIDFRILQGIRTAAEQLTAYKNGFSQIKSGGRHQFGCAIDFAVIDPKTGKLDTQGKTKYSQNLYAQVRAAFASAAEQMKIPIRTLESIGDLGHIELPKAFMPDNWKGK